MNTILKSIKCGEWQEIILEKNGILKFNNRKSGSPSPQNKLPKKVIDFLLKIDSEEIFKNECFDLLGIDPISGNFMMHGLDERLKNFINEKKLMKSPSLKNNFPPSPPPEAITDIRGLAKLTQAEAAAVIYRTLRNWQQFESGERKMDPALFELFKIKTGLHRYPRIEKCFRNIPCECLNFCGDE